MKIPKVRTWQVTMKDTGFKFRIDAPTKLLAKLNFREQYPDFWNQEIKTVGLLKGGG